MTDSGVSHDWYCVRVLFVFAGRGQQTYEEQLTLWYAADFSTAIQLAEDEAYGYANSVSGCSCAGLAQAYRLTEEPGHGSEVFSLMRDSALPTADYLSTFFDTGHERQGGSLPDER